MIKEDAAGGGMVTKSPSFEPEIEKEVNSKKHIESSKSNMEDLGNTNFPPVMSKLTFSQLTDNAEEFNKSISLR